MSADDERNTLRKAIEANSDEPYRSRSHPCTVRTQGIDGTIDVELDEGGPSPRASGVAMVHGIPGIRCEVANGARCRVQFDNGDPRKRVATSFDEQSATQASDLVSLNIANASDTHNAARKGELCAAGTLRWIQSPPGPGAIPTGGTIFYTPPSADPNASMVPVPWLVLVGPVQGQEVAPLELIAYIRTGSSIVKIGGSSE